MSSSQSIFLKLLKVIRPANDIEYHCKFSIVPHILLIRLTYFAISFKKLQTLKNRYLEVNCWWHSLGKESYSLVFKIFLGEKSILVKSFPLGFLKVVYSVPNLNNVVKVSTLTNVGEHVNFSCECCIFQIVMDEDFLN